MKKVILILSLVFAFTACHDKNDIATKQNNGLHYEFLDYIGPDSCMLYRCAYEGKLEANSVLLTICPNQKVTTTSYSQGKSTITNTVITDTTKAKS